MLLPAEFAVFIVSFIIVLAVSYAKAGSGDIGNLTLVDSLLDPSQVEEESI